jgi:hypothetical protein
MYKGKIFSNLVNPLTAFTDSNKVVDGFYETDDLIEKDLNSFRFRSDEFSKVHDGRHILFAGCSETFGCGDTIEKTWSNMLYKKIANDAKLSGYYSIGLPGGGFQDIINSTLEYIKQYSPNDIFILFPNVERFIGFYDGRYIPRIRRTSGAWGFNEGWLEDILRVKTSFRFKKYKTFDIKDTHELFVNFILQLKLLEEVCRLRGINLFYSTWSVGDLNPQYIDLDKNIKDYMFNNPGELSKYYSVSFNKLLDAKDELERSGLSYRKSDGHYGELFHKKWSDEFYNVYTYTC